MEIITGAVLRCRVTDTIYSGTCHMKARDSAFKDFIIRQGLEPEDILEDDTLWSSFLNQWIEEQEPIAPNEGFSTNCREFVSREEAYIIAMREHQAPPNRENKLKSEDLQYDDTEDII